MIKDGLVDTICCMCPGNCDIQVTLKDGMAIKLESFSRDGGKPKPLCIQGATALEYLYHPDRLTHPLKRVGKRGGGKWQEISWDEALDTVADAFNKVKKEYGPEAVLMVHGSAKGLMDTYLVRLANAFGTPNVVCSDHECHIPRLLSSEMTFGFLPGAEYDPPPACILVWGDNKAWSGFAAYQRMVEAHRKGAKLITIDPIESATVKMSDLWLQIRPGTDLALALAMINVIINEGLYDNEFVSKWTVGFDKLKTHIKDYTPEKASEITWIPAEMIKKTARFYAAAKPAHISWGNALDQSINSFQTGRAISILMAITGNLGVAGGEIESEGSLFRFSDKTATPNRVRERWSPVLELRDMIPAEKRNKKVGAELNLLPDFRYTTPQAVIKSILKGEPYRLRAAMVQASNPLSCWCNVQEVCKAFRKLDFLVVSDFFMTPTAALADIVLPSATRFEFDGIQSPPDGASAQLHRKVVQIGECRSDYEVITDLAKRMGLGEYVGDIAEAFWDKVLEPVGMSFAEFQKKGRFVSGNKRQYRIYEKNGFRTPSGKVEIYSSQLKEWGFDPLPVYRTPPWMVSDSNEIVNEYPLLSTTRKLANYHGSQGVQIPGLRKTRPEPITVLHPDTAGKLGIKEGDWLFVETGQGKIRQRANMSNTIDRRVVMVDSGWWFPEKGASEMYGWKDANYNVLTDDKPPFNREVGSFVLRGLPCKVYKAKD